ncbi:MULTISPECIES: hypothetical protein [Peptoniphilus]|uniref:hypothetical protein n=1 Tax=Peptoniphilus TaxID=162289 RepID=UPI0003B7E512|nr:MULTISPECIES: hypothetical protein [Peptoniphilus]ERT64109.1 hypothetical protein HMPREF1252_0233 [Peptoniphilus sp. BV3AC2]MDK8276420.1 hypothetical protein [Peptoniphilus duerdenii]
MKNKKFIIFLALLLVFSVPAYISAKGESKNKKSLSFSDVEKHEKYITTTKSFKIDGEILDEIPYKEGEFEGKLSRQKFVDIDYDKNIKTYKFGGWIQDKEYKEVAAAFEAQSKEAQKNTEELPMDIVKLSDGRYQKHIEVEKTFALEVEPPYEIEYSEGNMEGKLSRQRLVNRDEIYKTKTFVYGGWVDIKD